MIVPASRVLESLPIGVRRGYKHPILWEEGLDLEFDVCHFFLGIRRSLRHMTGSPCANKLKISSLLFSNPCGLAFQDVIFGYDSVWA